jgi:REP element-mobilizing transposase RayT
MGRPRKRHVQTSIRFPDKNGQQRGRRRGEKWRGKAPGRKPKLLGRPGSPHTKRPEVARRSAFHIVLRVNREVGSLRRRHMYRAMRAATIAVALRELNFETQGAFRIVHISIQRTHVHLIVEGDSKEALAKGLQGFQISAAKHINREYSVRAGLERRRRGNVFTDRYHQQHLTSPRQARNAMAYVLNNWRKHGEDRRVGRERDRGPDGAARWNVDPYSTGALFGGWQQRVDAELLWRWPETYQPLVVYVPQSWVLRTGWTRHGRVSFHEVPSSSMLER